MLRRGSRAPRGFLGWRRDGGRPGLHRAERSEATISTGSTGSTSSPRAPERELPGPSTAPAARRRAVVGLFLLGLLAVQVGWLVAVPPFYGIDEFDHAYRAASVAEGHWGPGTDVAADGRGELVRVPADVVEAAHEACAGLPYTGPDNCSAVGPPDPGGAVRVASAAASYNPAWYAVAGAAALPFEGAGALLAMRLVSLLVCDAAVLAALWLLLRRTGSPWAVLGLAVAATPVLVHSSALAAPNGVGYCAGLLLWTGLLALAEAGRDPRGALAAVAGGGVLVLLTHSTGPVWVLASLVCALPLLTPTLPELWERHRGPLVLAAGSLGSVAAACAAWVLAAGTNDPRGETGGGNGPVPPGVLLRGAVLWPLQAFATLRMRDQAAPLGVYAVGVALVVLLLGAAVVAADRATRLTLALVAAASLAVPAVATVLAYPHVGAAWQGRYGLPLACGLLVTATWTLARRRPAPPPALAVVLVAAMAAAHAWVLGAVLDDGLGGEHPGWHWAYVGVAALVAAAAWAVAASLVALPAATPAKTPGRPIGPTS